MFLNTQVTRFGSILLILFLVQILVGLYRYNARLAAYYDARADAVMMADRPTMILELVAGLTPDGVDFTKGLKTPAGEFRDVLKEVLRERK